MLRAAILLVCFGTTLAASAGCGPRRFQCDLRKCISEKWVCDGESDCNDGTDEKEDVCANKRTQRTCSEFQFRCIKGICIPQHWVCDGDKDCIDGSDEPDSCSVKNCTESEFRCGDGQCIAKRWRCDRQNDCSDGSDEQDCTNKTRPVEPNRFACKVGHSIPLSWKCDGELDCRDGSDEEGCPEATTTAKTSTICRKNEFFCGNSYCILNSWVCDGAADCPDGSDEHDCPTRACSRFEYTCNNSKCIPVYRKCNDINDCGDWSDENNCTRGSMNRSSSDGIVSSSNVTISGGLDVADKSLTTTTPAPVCNNITHFQCEIDNNCISRDLLCDGKKNCKDGEDEFIEVCGVNECEVNNGGCMQICINTREGYHCDCRKGYRLYGKYSCEDIDECIEVPGSCSQMCTNTIGNFHCSCLPGYEKDPANYTRCKAAEGEPYLLFSHSYDIRSLRLRDRDMTAIISDTRGATALDFLFNEGKILWSDKKENKIYRANLNNTDSWEVLVAGEEVSADGLAVDWIHRNVYYTDSKTFAVKLLSWDGKWSKTLASDKLGNPRAVAISPLQGYVYWTDWGYDAKIERSELDGSDRVAIVKAPYVAWPNGLTIDHSTNTIYWCDGRRRSISMANMDGSDVKVILYSQSVLRQPFSITVFEDRMYWTDWSRVALYSADKFTGIDIQNVSAGYMLEAPKVVHVYHQYRQPSGENVCLNHSCSHLCTRNPVGEAVCACPDGLMLHNNKVTCITKVADTVVESTVPPRLSRLQPLPVKIAIYSGDSDEVHERSSGAIDVGLVIGGILGIILIIIALVAGIFVWKRLKPQPIQRVRFHNSIYRKTTEEDDGRGYVIGQDQLVFSPSKKMPPRLTDADDVPLAPETDDDGE